MIMSSSRVTDTISTVGSESDVSIIENIDALEDFVVVSPGDYSDYQVTDPSAHPSATATSDGNEISGDNRAK
jgi:hypothetical protein